MHKKLLEYVLHKCDTTLSLLSKDINIRYHKLWTVLNHDKKFSAEELDIINVYLKKNTTLTDWYIDRRVLKLKRDLYEKKDR
tara:strand:- start:56 stop:301 length:246 start_codon:yes stop_codon:yes gene_type:complete